MKASTIHSRCECQAKLGAELDERRIVVRGWARDSRGGRTVVAPAHSMSVEDRAFQVAWACPFCTRNQLRSFDTGSLTFTDAAT